MAQYLTYPQLEDGTDFEATDIIARYREPGPVKRATAGALAAYMAGDGGLMKADFTNADGVLGTEFGGTGGATPSEALTSLGAASESDLQALQDAFNMGIPPVDLDPLTYVLEPYFGSTVILGDAPVTGTPSGNETILMMSEAVASDTRLADFAVYVTSVDNGTAVLKVIVPDTVGSGYSVVQNVPLTGIVGTGVLTLAPGANGMPDERLFIPAGARIGVGGATAQAHFASRVEDSITVPVGAQGVQVVGSAYPYALNASATLSPSDPVFNTLEPTRVSARNSALITQGAGWVTQGIGAVFPGVGGPGATTVPVTTLTPFLKSGYWVGIQYEGDDAGDAAVVAYSPNGDGTWFRQDETYRAVTIASGYNEFTFDEPAAVESDWIWQFIADTGTLNGQNPGGVYTGYYAAGGGSATYQASEFDAVAAYPYIRPILSYTQTVKQVAAEASRGTTQVFDEAFAGTSTPTNWVVPAGWAVNDGLVSSGSGGNTVIAYYNKFSNAQRKTIQAQFTFTGAGRIAGFVTHSFLLLAGGSQILIDATDLANPVLRHKGVPESCIPSGSGLSTALGFPVVLNRPYTMTAVRRRTTVTITVCDTVTGATKVWSTPYGGGGQGGPTGTYPGLMWGNVGFVHFGAGVVVNQARFNIDVKAPKVIVIGDSNSEQTPQMMEGDFVAANMLEDYRGKGDMINCARSGGTITQALQSIDLDVGLWGADQTGTILILDLTTNPPLVGSPVAAQIAQWETDTQAYVDYCTARNITVVFRLQLPYPLGADAETFAAATRSAMMTYQFGPIPYINQNQPMTESNALGNNWVDTYTNDTVHVSYPEGADVVFNTLIGQYGALLS